ncbi:MAG TPA: CinA family nicotinamide mononucleotide deamidase-related protein [Thermoleophilia bacterium]|nr:CinA family nicotinamide mononucleotide deamidase-related protein [Thermoleophilia bacterium]
MRTELPQAIIVLTGDELLDGRTRDTNGAFLAARLAADGVQVARLTVVPDDMGLLVAALREALAFEPAVVIISGGLGTTHDDLTAAAIAAATGRRLEEHPEALAMVARRTRDLAERRHAPFAEMFAVTRREALLPKGARPVPPAGVAPGIALRHEGTLVYALPGVPSELRAMWPWVRGELAAAGVLGDAVTRVVRIFGVGELQVGTVVDGVPRTLIDVAINVGGGEVAVRIRHACSGAAQAEADALVEALVAAVPVYSTDGRTVDEIVAEGLRARGATVAVAESCTGGLVGGRFTDLRGSSDYFLGGVIAYANEAKVALLGVDGDVLARHGAVSAEVAAAMAEGARAATGATFALSTTGVAGPDGGTPEKPVGLVYLGCAGPDGCRTVRERFPGDRASVREWAVTRALHLLRETLEAGEGAGDTLEAGEGAGETLAGAEDGGATSAGGGDA